MIRRLSLALFILLFLCSSVFAEGNKVDKAIYNKISLSNKFYTNKTEALLTKTGQTTTYRPVALDDDGALELGIAHSFTVLTTGQYAGSTNVTINSKTHVTSNACVRNENTGDEWLREVIQTDIGSAADGKLFWDQYTIAAESVTFAEVGGPGTDTITAAAGTPFDTGALCVGRIFTVSGTVSNDGTYTVSAIANNIITTTEDLADEGPIATDFASVDDLIWDLKDQANSAALAGYTDWRIPNLKELESITDLGNNSPALNTTVFPSTPLDYCLSSTTYDGATGNVWTIYFTHGGVAYRSKKNENNYIRLVR